MISSKQEQNEFAPWCWAKTDMDSKEFRGFLQIQGILTNLKDSNNLRDSKELKVNKPKRQMYM